MMEEVEELVVVEAEVLLLLLLLVVVVVIGGKEREKEIEKILLRSPTAPQEIRSIQVSSRSCD